MRPHDVDLFRFCDCITAAARKFQESVKDPNRYSKLREGDHQVGIFVDFGSICAEFTVPEPEMRRLILPFNNLSKKSSEGSGLGGGGGRVTGGLCGGVGW